MIEDVLVFIKCYQCGGETLGPVVEHSVRDSRMNLKNKCKMVTKVCKNNHVKFRDLPDCLALHGCRIKEQAPKGDL